MGPGGGFGMGWMWVWWLLITLGVIALVVGLVRAGGARGGGDMRGRRSSAREILDERFARGESTSRSTAPDDGSSMSPEPGQRMTRRQALVLMGAGAVSAAAGVTGLVLGWVRRLEVPAMVHPEPRARRAASSSSQK